jgi:hypothetical protein
LQLRGGAEFSLLDALALHDVEDVEDVDEVDVWERD